MKQSNSIAQDRRAASADTVGHSSVQPWSAGPLFPCIIGRVERWSSNAGHVLAGDPILAPTVLESVSYLLIAYGREEEYATREDAERVARWLNRDPEGRKHWAKRAGFAAREVVGDFHGQAIYADEMDQRARNAGAV